MSDDTPTDDSTDSGDDATGDDSGILAGDADGIRRYLWWGGVVVVGAFAVVAATNAYLSAGAAIDIWVSRRYQPVFQAAFNLVVLLVAAVGLSALVRRRA